MGRTLKVFNSLLYKFSQHHKWLITFTILLFKFRLKALFALVLLGFFYSSYRLLKHPFQKHFDGETHPDYDYPYLSGYQFHVSSNIQVIPMVDSVRRDSSQLKLSDGFRIVSNQKILSKDLQSAINRYTNYIALIGHISVQTSAQVSTPSSNELLLDCSSIDWEKIHSYPTMDEDESYRLHTNHSGSYLTSSTLTGFIRGLSTYVQLIETDDKSKESVVPHVMINDRARFVWRGLMLDVSRHWLPMKAVQRTLDAMEMSKLNVLHLHLSDDQGFRVESIRYPLLHDREFYFTQREIRDLVEYARERRIRVIPEFDIPGHTTSWFVGYPELATAPGPYQVETRWGVMKPTMDPTKEKTYEFLDEFFAEMTKLFPDEYFHIGGDEVEGSQWMSSTSVQKFIQEHQLKNKNGMQAYFNTRIQKLLKKYKKSMIGWEEIVEETKEDLLMDQDAIIQSWKSRQSLVGAVTKGYRALLSHGYYLDYLWPAKSHYHVDPVSKNELSFLTENQSRRILGGEACMWTEYVSEATLDSRIWPRVLAVAERLWSTSALTSEHNLYQRLFRMDRLFEQLHINLTHRSSYKAKLEALIVDPNHKKDLLHPFVILANSCEAQGIDLRSAARGYSTNTSLTTFADALQSESEFIQELESTAVRYDTLQQTFKTWSINDLRLRQLFDAVDGRKSKQVWIQDVEQLSVNLAHVGRIGLRILSYGRDGVFPREENHDMRNWTISRWIYHQDQLLAGLEKEVQEVRLAAVRPVRRVLDSIIKNA